MGVRQTSTSPTRRFNEIWTVAARVKAKLRRNGKRKIGAKFFPASLQEKHSARLSLFWCATKTLGLKIMRKCKGHSGRHMPISHMRPNTEFETGRLAASRRRARRSYGAGRGAL